MSDRDYQSVLGLALAIEHVDGVAGWADVRQRWGCGSRECRGKGCESVKGGGVIGGRIGAALTGPGTPWQNGL
jgi:hypothetical protein